MIVYLYKNVLKSKVDRLSIGFYRLISISVGILLVVEVIFLLFMPLVELITELVCLFAFYLFFSTLLVKPKSVNIFTRVNIILSYALIFVTYYFFPLIAIMVYIFPVSIYLIFTDINKSFVNYVLSIVSFITIALLAFVSKVEFGVDMFIPELVLFLFAIAFYGILIRFFSYSNHEARNYLVSQMEAIQESIESVVRNTDEIERQQRGVLSVRQNVEHSIRNERLARGKLLASQEQLDQFAYAASHDLKEPIRTIRSFVQMARRKISDERLEELDLLEHFDLVETSAFSMHSVLEKLLAYSRVSSSKMKITQVDVVRLWTEVVDNASPSDRIKFSFSKESFNVNSVVIADVEQLRCVFKELLNNAILFCKPGVNPEIEFKIEYSKNQRNVLQISISDNGLGMERKYLEQVFGLFKRLQARELYPGVGLGLPLARKIVESMNGKLWLTSIEGFGTSAHIELPLLLNN